MRLGHCRRAVCFVLLGTAAGCAPQLSGGWETVGVHPPGASFPFNRVEFDPAGKYTASGLYDESGRMVDEVRTTTGDFRVSGSRLDFQPASGQPHSYRVRRRLDGRLEVSLHSPGQPEPIRAILAPASN